MPVAADRRRDAAPDRRPTPGVGRNELSGPAEAAAALWWRRYAAPVVAGLAIRLFMADVVAQPSLPPGADEYYYRGQAELLTHGYWWVLPGSVGHGLNGVPGANHPPLFSAVLAVADLLGLHGMDGQRAFLAVLSVIAVVCCGRIGARLAGRSVELTVAWVAALWPTMWIYSGQDLSETVTVPLVAATVLALYRLRERPTPARAAVLGLLVALGALTRPELLFLVVMFAPLWFAPRLWRSRLILTAVFLAVIVAVVGPWVGRNLHDYHDTELLSVNLGSVLAGSNCAITYSGPLLGAWDSRCTNAVTPPPGDASVMDHREQSVGAHYARTHVSRVPLVAAARLGRALGVWPSPAQQVSWNATAGGVWPEWASWLYLLAWDLSIPLVIVAAVGLRRGGAPAWPLYALVALYLVISVVLYADPRFASSCQPALAVLIGIGLARAMVTLVGPSRGNHARAAAAAFSGRDGGERA
ncbi:MAG TPA: glycosyltransferase family 39 protein [Acidimicrobiales bacterium]|nr:glycosyltransferase family 39 protein [Acidimicrobiales bacterium]